MNAYDYVLRLEIEEDCNLCREIIYWKNPIWRVGIRRKMLLKRVPGIAMYRDQRQYLDQMRIFILSMADTAPYIYFIGLI
jgi:hypothetical protein